VCFELTRRIRRLLSFSRSTTFGYISRFAAFTSNAPILNQQSVNPQSTIRIPQSKLAPIERFSRAHAPVMTFAAIATRAKSLGFVNVAPDQDGAFRRAPLLFR
jgi:hypothetical protein